MIIPDTRQRLEAAYQELQSLLVSGRRYRCAAAAKCCSMAEGFSCCHGVMQAGADEDLKQSEEAKDAQQLVGELNSVIGAA